MNTNPESKRFLRRSLFCGFGVLFFFFILFIRLFYLQVIEYHFYATLSKRNVISMVPVQPNRGIIYDRNGVVLAENKPVYSLMVIPARVKDLKDTLKTLTTLVGLTPHEIKNFDRIKNQYYPYQSVPLKQALSEQAVDAFYVHQYQFPGVMIEKNMIRYYPLGKAVSNVVGYVGRITAAELAKVNPMNYTASDDIGKAGIEAEYEKLLHGTMGAEEAEIDANGKIVRVLKTTPAIPGDNLYLTIDSKLQVYAEKLLGKNSGAVVAIQPTTGQVLALATHPGYNPNWFVKGMTEKQYQSLIKDPRDPLLNRATRGLYAPGSTVKPFFAFGALNDGVINTQDYIFDPGWYRIPHTQHIFHNWVKKGFGWVNVTSAITLSCDTFFYQLADAWGIDNMDADLKQFGFGEVTGIDLPNEQAGIIPSPAWKKKQYGLPWYAGDTVVAGIGQGYFAVTPLQLASAVATISERGIRLQPTLLLKLQNTDGSMTTMQPIQLQPIVEKAPGSWGTVIKGMEGVIDDPRGTAYISFQGAKYSAAGKTGTAQVASDNAKGIVAQTGRRFQNNHVFICFAPVNHPQIAVAVVVEHIRDYSQKSVIIGRKIIDFYMQELQQAQAAQANTPPAPSAVLPQPAANATATLPSPAQNSSALPQPQSASTSTPVANTQNKKKKSPTPEQLQQQMDMRLDEQLEMQGGNQ